MKLLLIEDDVFFVKFYASKLIEQGFTVDTAVNGEEGLTKMAANRPDLIILDLIMPVKNGFEVLQAMQQNEQLKQIPVLVFSTLGQERDIEEAKRLGARECVNKSFFDFEVLKQKIIALGKK